MPIWLISFASVCGFSPVVLDYFGISTRGERRRMGYAVIPETPNLLPSLELRWSGIPVGDNFKSADGEKGDVSGEHGGRVY